MENSRRSKVGAPIIEAVAHTNHVVSVYPDRVDIRSGWQGQNTESLDLKDVSNVDVKGLVNCTLTIASNKGRVFTLNRMALPEARGVKRAIEAQKSRAGLYD